MLEGNRMLYRHRLATVCRALSAALLCLMLRGPALAQTAAVLTQHNDAGRTGANLSETILNTSNVSTATFGKLFSINVDGQLYAQPLYMPQVSIAGGNHNVVFLATENDSVYACDADTGSILWQSSLISPAAGVVPMPVSATRGNVNPVVGITSTPVIDPVSGTIYVVASTQETVNGVTAYCQRLHALDIKTGLEKFGGPTLIQASVPGIGDGSVNGVVAFDPTRENQRPGLLLSGGQIYIAWASHGDHPPFHGWVMTYNAATLAQTGVFCDTPNSYDGGIWQSGQGLTTDAAGNVYLITSNGAATVQSGGQDYGDCFLRFAPGSLSVADWFLPKNYHNLDIYDTDLGSAGILAIPGTRLLCGGGKQGRLYLVDTTNLGGYNANIDPVVQSFQATYPTAGQTGHIHGSPVYWNGPSWGPAIYLWAENDVLRAYQFVADGSGSGQFNTTAISRGSALAPVVNAGMPGGFLSVSANGSAPGTGILWAATSYKGDAEMGRVPGIVYAYDASDLTHELWDSHQNLSRDDIGYLAKFTPPTVVNGKLYMASFGALGTKNTAGRIVVYGLLPLGGGGGGDALSGTVIGTPGSWYGSGNDRTKVFDQDTNSFFDAPAPGNGDWAGLDLGKGKTATVTSVRFYPRLANESRMVGGKFQGSNSATFASGVTTFYTVTAQPPPQTWTTVTVTNAPAFRYLRYLSPNGGYGNISEVEFHGH